MSMIWYLQVYWQASRVQLHPDASIPSVKVAGQYEAQRAAVGGERGETQGGRAPRPPYSRGAACRSRDPRAFYRDAINTAKDNKPSVKTDWNNTILTPPVHLTIRVSNPCNIHTM